MEQCKETPPPNCPSYILTDGHLFDPNFRCILCNEINTEKLQEQEKHVISQARQLYQQEIHGVAIQIFNGLLAKEIGESIRGSELRMFKVMVDMIDMSLTGAIHFITNLKALKPGPKYIEQYKESLPPQIQIGAAYPMGRAPVITPPPSTEE